MSVDLKARAAQSVELAQQAGAEDAWSTVSQSRNVQFEYRDGNLEKVKDTTSQSLGVRIYAGGRYSSHSTTDLNPERLQDFIAEAVAITAALEPDEYRRITPEALFRDRPGDDLDLVDASVQALEREQRVAWCRALDEVAHQHGDVISATSGVYDGIQRSASASSNGFLDEQRSTYCWFGASVTLRDQGDKRAEDGFYAGGAHVADLPGPEEVGRKALTRTVSRLGSEKGPTVRASMVVDARAASSLIGRLLGPANARSVQQDRSFWAPLIGEQAFSKTLTIVDDPLIVRGLASRRYDDEGISARALPIVEDGIVSNIYVDTYYGRKGDLRPTTGSSSNRVVRPGNHSLAELLSEVGEGVYVTSWLGGKSYGTSCVFTVGLRVHILFKRNNVSPVG